MILGCVRVKSRSAAQEGKIKEPQDAAGLWRREEALGSGLCVSCRYSASRDREAAQGQEEPRTCGLADPTLPEK